MSRRSRSGAGRPVSERSPRPDGMPPGGLGDSGRHHEVGLGAPPGGARRTLDGAPTRRPHEQTGTLTMTMTTRAVSLAAVLALGLGTAACSSSPTPGAAATAAVTTSAAATSAAATAAPTDAAGIFAQAKAHALAATSGAFAGSIDQGGTTMKIDFKGTGDGKEAEVSLDLGTDGTLHLISVPAGIFMQADPTFWKAQQAPASVQAAGDKFVKAPASAKGITDGLSLKAFLEKAFAAVTAGKISEEVGEETIDGVDCYVLTDAAGGKAEGALYISKDTLELVRFSGSSAAPGRLDFSKWNEDLALAAPPADQVLTVG